MGASQAHLTAQARKPVAKDAFGKESGFVVHPLLQRGALADRPYEVALAREALGEPTLVVLPAGLGTAAVAVLVAAERLRQAGGFVLALAPTRPLARQLKAAFEGALSPSLRVAEVTGRTSRAAGLEVFEKAQVVVATPETVAGELSALRLDLGRCSLLVVDEAQRAVGDYAYVEVAKALRRDRPGGLVLALTAGGGGDRRRIAAVMDALGLRRVEARTREDLDVKPFLAPLSVEVVEVELDEPLKVIQALLEREVDARLRTLVKQGALPETPSHLVGKRQLQAAGHRMRRGRRGDKGAFFEGLKAQAQAMLLVHALELCETQGAGPLHHFLAGLGTLPYASRAERALAASQGVKDVARLARAHAEVFHPKVAAAVELLRDLVRERPGARALVFVPHHDTARALAEALSRPPPLGPGLCAAVLEGRGRAAVGGAAAERQEEEAVQGFAKGAVQVLVATSAAGEGLHMPDTDLVLFFEGASFEPRAIERRGRSGRTAPRRVVVLVAKDTRDEAALEAADARERRIEPPVRWLKAGSGAPRPARGRNQALDIEDTAPAAPPGRAGEGNP